MRSGGVGRDHGEGDAKVSNPERGGSTAFEMLGTSLQQLHEDAEAQQDIQRIF